jgi:membrane-associated HD superfamily phosphohydrolase
MYLPDYVYNAFQNASITENKTTIPLVLKESQLLRYPEKQIDIQWYNPFSVFSLLLLLTIVVTFKDQKRNIRSKWLDFTLFFGTGVLGIIICFLWFFTDHYTAPNNFNLLWAFVLNFFVAFILLKSRIPSWTSKYLLFYLFLLFGAIIASFIGLQQFSNAIFPIMAMLFLRTFYIYRLLTFKK